MPSFAGLEPIFEEQGKHKRVIPLLLSLQERMTIRGSDLMQILEIKTQ